MTPPSVPVRGSDSPAHVLQRVADEMVSPSISAPAGCVLGIEVEGARTVVTAGRAAPEASSPMQRHTMFDLASVSKVVGTTSCLHRLAGMRLLDVSDEIRRFVPSYGGAAGTTLGDLLQHRGGLWEWQPIYLAPGGQEDPFHIIDGLPLRYPPGRDRHYSDLGFITLGRVIEAVVQAPLEVAVSELVAGPLGLEPFRYGPVSGDVATSGDGDRVEQTMVATGDPYPVLWPDDGFAWRTGPIRGTVNDCNCAHALGGVAGHAGLFATIDALLDVATSLSVAGEFPSLWDATVTAQFFAAGEDRTQALGWRRSQIIVDTEPLTLLWHPGFTGTAVGFLPGRHVAVAFAANRLLAEQPRTTTDLWARALAALTEILTPHEWKQP